MTIPQAIVRRAMGADEIDEDLGNISFGSTGALHESRDLLGAEAEKSFPDFVTVKVIPHGRGQTRRRDCVRSTYTDYDIHESIGGTSPTRRKSSCVCVWVSCHGPLGYYIHFAAQWDQGRACEG
ncbi:hypothetical protein L208DRAFT_1396291 [Tricholoma matsutake]|nr:hypothetical protein L208DRAFT_1396291 [Tricholoma matsutake 945]